MNGSRSIRPRRAVAASLVAGLAVLAGVVPARAFRVAAAGGGGSDPGGLIAFVRDRGGPSDIWVMGADGSHPRRLGDGAPNSQPTEPVWSPDGTRIGFVNLNTQPTDDDPDDDDTTRVWVVNLDGTGLAQLTRFSSYVSDMSWSADGSRIAFDDLDGIFVVASDGSDHSLLTVPGDFLDRAPAWSPDGASIAFVSFRTGSDEVWVMDADGGEPRQLTSFDSLPWYSMDHQPVWSPDGSRIAFTVTGDVWVTSAAAGGAGETVNLTAGQGGHDPVWSPDGSRIAFTSSRTGQDEVWVMDADGSAARPLTGSRGGADATWSPDGRRIAFTRNGDIWVMDADGSHAENLTRSPRREGAPAWQPSPLAEEPTPPDGDDSQPPGHDDAVEAQHRSEVRHRRVVERDWWTGGWTGWSSGASRTPASPCRNLCGFGSSWFALW